MRDELQAVLDAVQVEITRSYTDALTDGDKNGRLRDYIEKCVLDGGHSVWGLTTRQLIDRLFMFMHSAHFESLANVPFELILAKDSNYEGDMAGRTDSLNKAKAKFLEIYTKAE